MYSIPRLDSLLYLSLQVLILLDSSYLSRFWTQLEAWLSFREASGEGLKSCPWEITRDRRCCVVGIHGAKDEAGWRETLIARWAHVSVTEAVEKLRKRDVVVTNQRDKEVQLEKVLQIDERFRSSLRTTVEELQRAVKAVDGEMEEWMRASTSSTLRHQRSHQSAGKEASLQPSCVRRDPQRTFEPLRVEGLPPALLELASTDVLAHACAALESWTTDVAALDALSGGRCLSILTPLILHAHGLLEDCGIELPLLLEFLGSMESSMRAHAYHNAVQAADAMLTMHLYLVQFGVVFRLSQLDVLSGLLAALLHDYDHPGTTNTHEVRTSSALAITYYDTSCLEHFHIARAFEGLRQQGTNFLRKLTPSDFAACRNTVAQLILATDLTHHHALVLRLTQLSAVAGHAATAPSAWRRLLESWRPRRPSATATAEVAKEAERLASRRRSGVFMQLFGRCASRISPDDDVIHPALQHSSSTGSSMEGSARGSAGDLKSGSSPQGAAQARLVTRRRSSGDSVRRALSSRGWVSPLVDGGSKHSVDDLTCLTVGLKFADLGHVIKPWAQHFQTSVNLQNEFFALGDREQQMIKAGQLSTLTPLCDRNTGGSLARRQVQFFEYFACDFYEAVADLLDPLARCERPKEHWLTAFRENFASWRAQDAEEQAHKETTGDNANSSPVPGGDLGA